MPKTGFRALSLAIAYSGLLLFAVPVAHADYTIYSQLDDSGEIVSQQPSALNTWIGAPLGSLFLGKDRLTITFTMRNPSAGTYLPTGVGLGTSPSNANLQRYYFTAADRALLASDGEFHTFTVTTGTTTLGLADGETPVYLTFFGLMQIQYGTQVKSNAEGTVPYVVITAPTEPMHPPVPQAPPGSITVYEQSDNSNFMTHSQPTSLNAFIDSASLGNLPLGQGPLYLTFTMKSPRTSSSLPRGVCIEPMSQDCGNRLQTYYFTAADRALLDDGAYHTFTVLTGTTTSTYADGTRPVNIGFFGLYQVSGNARIKSNADATIPFLTIKKPPPADPCAVAGTCASNVLFLPGLEASRLYRPDYNGDVDGVWEPVGDSDALNLKMDTNGAAEREDIYTRDVIDTAYVPIKGNVYKSFLEQLSEMKSENVIADYATAPYDWRLRLDDVLESGAELSGGRIYYSGPLGATSSPYIIQELRRLAASSKTGKVTLVAHSNGGLLAKALVDKLGAESSELIDKIIFVAVPQAGTPKAVGAILHGFEQALPIKQLSLLGMTEATARELARNMPSVYNLLPSENYFTYVDDPTITISIDPLLAPWRTEYAPDGIIHSGERLHTFLTDQARTVLPTSNPLTAPIIGNDVLYDDSENVHVTQDSWTPPSDIELIEIAGWGMPTLKTIAYYQGVKSTCTVRSSTNSTCAVMTSTPALEYKPETTLDGDGTVVVPSALWTPGVQKYWVDLKDYDSFVTVERQHADILEIPQLRTFIKSIMTNSGINPLPDFIHTSTPDDISPEETLHFTLHSPLTINLYDNLGNHTGFSTTTNSLEEDIPGSHFETFGEVQYVSVPSLANVRLIMNGYEDGSFTLDIEETDGDSVVAETSFAGVPSFAETKVTMEIPAGAGVEGAGDLQVDAQGDGVVDIELEPKLNETTVFKIPYEWSGFLQPIDDPAYQAGQSPSVFKAGSTVPVKFQLRNGLGEVIQAETLPEWLPPKRGISMSASVDEPAYALPATSGNTYRFDPTSQQYIYNWNTKGLASRYWYTIYAKLDDGNTYSVTVGLR